MRLVKRSTLKVPSSMDPATLQRRNCAGQRPSTLNGSMSPGVFCCSILVAPIFTTTSQGSPLGANKLPFSSLARQ